MGSKRKRGAKEGANGAQNAQKRSKNDANANATSAKQPKIVMDKSPFVETPIGDERKREAGLYELLGSEDANERIEAADCIISGLLDGECVSEQILQRHLDRRLFRGLASGRNASRLGFSLVITEILGQLYGEKALAESKYPGLPFGKALEILTEKIQIVGNVPGQEERDQYFGHLFGIECFVRAGILFSDLSRWNMILDLLLKLANKKVWLRSQCGWVIVQAIGKMCQEDVEATLGRVADAGLAKTPEGVAIWLVARDRFPDLTVKPWSNPLASKTLNELAAVLKESFQDFGLAKDRGLNGDRSQRNKQGGWTAQLHFVWDVILSHFVKQGSAEVENFEQFWARVFDDGLFSRSATDGQKFKGFMVFQKMLEGLVSEHAHIECMFSKNFTTCLINQAAKENRFLNRAATKTLKTIEGVVSSHPVALVPVLKSVLGRNGAYNFDQISNNKTVDRLLQNLNGSTGGQVLKIITRPIDSLSKLETSQAVSMLRVYADYLSKILNAASGEDEVTFSKALQDLSQLAYSRPKHIPEEALTEQIRELCRARLESSFAKLTRSKEDYIKFCRAVLAIDPDSVAMTGEIKDSVKEALSRMQKLLKRKTTSETEKGLAQSLALLHAVSIFQLYNEDPDAMEVLNDLAQFSDRLKKGKSGDKADEDSGLLVEILLSMVARPSSLMRQVSQQVFDAFTRQVSAEGLELLTGPLGSDESARGQQELFNTEDDGMEIDEDGEEGSDDDENEGSVVEIDSDVEFVDLDEKDEEESGDEDKDESDEEDEDEDEGEDEEAEQEGPIDLDDLVGKILNSHRLDKDNEAESSESDADMSDSDMLALDEKLAEVFKQRVIAKPDSKKQKKDAKQSVVNFKHRILDLLDIYVKNETLQPLAFSLLLPLLNLMRVTSTKPLATRACEIILNYQKGLKKARSNKEEAEAPDAEELLGLLLEVHTEAGKDNAHAYAKAASAASLIVASTLFAADKSKIKDIAAVYAKTQSEWVIGEAKLQNSFFADWNNWCQNQASQFQV